MPFDGTEYRGGGGSTTKPKRVSRQVNIGCGISLYLLDDDSIEYVGPFGEQMIIQKGGTAYGVPYSTLRHFLD